MQNADVNRLTGTSSVRLTGAIEFRPRGFRLTGALFRLTGAIFGPRGFTLTGALFWLAYWSDILANQSDIQANRSDIQDNRSDIQDNQSDIQAVKPECMLSLRLA